jgi:hypothetical protein
MSTVKIEESNMYFLFDERLTYRPEKNEPYRTLTKGNCIKSCDIVTLNGKSLLLIEAKTTAPNVGNAPDLLDYVQEFHYKTCHSLLMLLGMSKNRPYRAMEKPLFLDSIDWAHVSIRPVLVVKSHKREWLAGLHEKIGREMRGIVKAFQMETPLVLNEELAREKGWLSQSAGETHA